MIRTECIVLFNRVIVVSEVVILRFRRGGLLRKMGDFKNIRVYIGKSFFSEHSIHFCIQRKRR